MATSTDNILITGASGFIGSALAFALAQDGFSVFILDRVDPQSPFYYDSELNTVRLDEETPLRAVINLAGANIADGRWSPQRKKTIWDSRVGLTRVLSEALAKLPQKPEVLLSASAIGYYGNQCNTATDEFGNPGTDFLADLSVAWESATQAASDAGIRVVWMRFGLVLAAHGGVLKKLVLPLRAAVVGRVGDGQHLQPWITLSDLIRLIKQLLVEQDFSGPINLVAPAPATNAEFSSAMARALRRPQLPPLPAAVTRTLFGEMADAALLASSHIISLRQQELAATLAYPTLDGALAAIYATPTPDAE